MKIQAYKVELPRGRMVTAAYNKKQKKVIIEWQRPDNGKAGFRSCVEGATLKTITGLTPEAVIATVRVLLKVMDENNLLQNENRKDGGK